MNVIKNLSKVFALTLLFVGLVYSQELPKKAKEITPLKVGEMLPNVKLANKDAKEVSLLDIVKRSDLSLIVVYRGGWCFFCNKQLSIVAEVLPQIKKMGVQVLAVAPDTPESMVKTIQENKLDGVQHLSDSKTNFIKAVGIAYVAPKSYKSKLLEASNQVNSDILPVPSFLIVNKEGKVLSAHFSINHKKMLPKEYFIDELQKFKQK